MKLIYHRLAARDVREVLEYYENELLARFARVAGVFHHRFRSCGLWLQGHAGSLSLPLAAAMSGAYLFHLFCDAISGGINWLYPVTDFFWGDYWIDLRLWIPIDVVLLLFAYYFFRIRPGMRPATGEQ